MTFQEMKEVLNAIFRCPCNSYSGNFDWYTKAVEPPTPTRNYSSQIGGITVYALLRKRSKEDTYFFHVSIRAGVNSGEVSADSGVALSAMFAEAANFALKVERLVEGQEWEASEVEEALPNLDMSYLEENSE